MIVGLILAGGRARRFGGDKARALLDGLSLAERVVARAHPQVARLVISSNDPAPPAAFAAYPVLADRLPGFRGPLAGLLTGMYWAVEHAPQCRSLATFSVDAPFFPADLVVRLVEAAEPEVPAIATSGGRPHPVFGLWPLSLREGLHRYLDSGASTVFGFACQSGAREVPFAVTPFDPFFNINHPEDVADAADILRRHRPDAGVGTDG